MSMDPALVEVGNDYDFDTREKGALLVVYNDTDEPIEIVIHTSWNKENERFNVHPVLFQGTLEQVLERAATWQVGEKKPVYGYIRVSDLTFTDLK